MTQEFESGAKALVTRDPQGHVRDVLHSEEPFTSTASSPLLAAREYLDRFGSLLGIAPAELANFSLSPERLPVKAGVEYRFGQEKPQFDMTTVVFEQTYFGLPVWQAGVSVHMRQRPFVVMSAQSARHADVNAAMPGEKALQRIARLDEKTLSRLLGVDGDKDCDPASLVIVRRRLIVFRYEQAQRILVQEAHRPETGVRQRPTPIGLHPVLPVPPVGESIEEGRHYVAAEVTFKLTWRGIVDLPWLAVIDVESLSVLYLRAFIDNLTGLVFKEDPITANGGPLPDAGAAALNALRTTVPLTDVAPPVAGTFTLTGEHVTLVDVENPTVAPPAVPAGSSFDHAARSDDFAAVNAYYHCNRFFGLVEDLGFDLQTYFTGTLFPSVVDHRGHFGTADGLEINAYCMGNGTFGIDRTAFMLADLTDTANPIGLACDWRVVLHELGGHGILYNHVNSANFGFAHSAGDSFAAVLNDPDTHAPDRFQTFPWVYSVIDRRHDRDVTAGWAWGGTNDVGGYSSEEILCTTHFRLYRSVGGDSAELAMRQYAARYLAYLMLRTIGSLTQPTNPATAEAYASAMIAAERGNWTSEDHVGSVCWKVVRWAFEKQGAYQPAGAPTPVVTEGDPPPVDVYIDDGRHGEYPFLAKFWETADIWNRLEPDGVKDHQTPRMCKKNHAYVCVKNRGTKTAKGARVHAYHCRPSAGLVWPDDFEPMTTESLGVPELAPGASAVVGPFEWMPVHAGHEVMFMSVTARTDRANNDLLTGLPSAVGPTPLWRLVPADNNIAMRALIPVPGGGGRCALEAAFCNRKFWAHNPFAKAARMEIRAVLPPVLESRGWAMSFNNPGGGSFTLGPRDAREIRPLLQSGRDFSAAELADAGSAVIAVLVLADGIVVGGLSFSIDPCLDEPANERCGCKEGKKPGPDGGKRPACGPAKRCGCEPCIDDRCCPPAPPCCCEATDPCGDPAPDEDSKDESAARCDGVFRVCVEVERDPCDKRPATDEACSERR